MDKVTTPVANSFQNYACKLLKTLYLFTPLASVNLNANVSVTEKTRHSLARPSQHRDNLTIKSMRPQSFDVIAHRGGAGEWPGETTYAFRHAIESRADMIEMDVWGTSDDPPVLILMHSSDISKMTEGTGDVRSLKFKENIEHLNAAYQWSPDGGKTFPFRNTEPVLRVARLEDVLKEFKNHRMNIEIKQKRPSIVKPFLDAIERSGVPAQNLLIASFHTAVLKEFRKQCKQRNVLIATSASTWEWVRFYFGNYLLHLGYRPPTEVLQMAERVPVVRLWLLSQRFIRRAHDAGLKVHAWTVDDPDDMKRAIMNGVDGIITDFPTRLRALVDERIER